MSGERFHRLRQSDLTWRQTSDSTVVLDQRRWVYLSLNGSGAVLWSSIAIGATETDLAKLLQERYGLEPETAKRDVEAFTAMLREHRLLAEDG